MKIAFNSTKPDVELLSYSQIKKKSGVYREATNSITARFVVSASDVFYITANTIQAAISDAWANDKFIKVDDEIVIRG